MDDLMGSHNASMYNTINAILSGRFPTRQHITRVTPYIVYGIHEEVFQAMTDFVEEGEFECKCK